MGFVDLGKIYKFDKDDINLSKYEHTLIEARLKALDGENIKDIVEYVYNQAFEDGTNFGYEEGYDEGHEHAYDNYSEINRGRCGSFG